MKIVFAGSPQFAVPALEKLVESGKQVIAVITQPDKPTGRKKILTPTPVKQCAQKLGLPVYDFAKIRTEVKTLSKLGADIMITCAYGQILTEEVLGCFKGGVWNIHASLLPKFRGASPIQSAILAGESHTGVTVMKTELSLDTGDMLLVKRCEIGLSTCGELTGKLSVLGAEAAVEAVELLERGDCNLLMQNEAAATYCKKISKADGKVDFNRPAAEILRQIKAFSPEPAAYCNFCGANLNILDAALGDDCNGKTGEVVAADKRGVTVKCGEGTIVITELQPASGKRMRAADFVNGRKIKAGDVLD
ncbi:MAG: methionyl-tRNA formyltransferase [Clostridia bacterium]|jgi:methionyl-tRNA formyltransferase|nr:methionyl-tRNA formyltransferase [Clostridia bacterium]